MNSSIYGKVEKALRYSQQPERVRINALSLTFHGAHDEYQVSLIEQHWRCTCHSFETLGTCSHVMAVERMLEPMLPVEARRLEPLEAMAGR